MYNVNTESHYSYMNICYKKRTLRRSSQGQSSGGGHDVRRGLRSGRSPDIDMGLELRSLLAQTVEMKGGSSLYSDGM